MPETWEYTLSVPNDLRAVTVCRRTLRLILTMHGLIGLADTAELLAAELVSNAVRHTKGPAALRVRRSPEGVVWIGAWDADPVPPEPPGSLEGWQSLRRRGGGWGWRWRVLTAVAGSRPLGSGSGDSTWGES